MFAGYIKDEIEALNAWRFSASLVTTCCRKNCTFRKREQEKEEEKVMKMRVALNAGAVAQVPYPRSRLSSLNRRQIELQKTQRRTI